MTDVTLTQEQLKEMMENAVSAALNVFHTQPHTDDTERTKIKAAERPEIDIGCNENHWAFFLEEWKSYKRRTSLKPTQLVENLFNETKKFIVGQIHEGVRNFEINRPSCLWTDWSKKGLGFYLVQKYCACDISRAPVCCNIGWKLVFAGSRFTTDAESRYAPIEGEALAVCYALDKCRLFIVGCPNLIVATDHKPLVKILGDKSLENIANPRLFNMKEKTVQYQFTIKHVDGKRNCSADACSRSPTTEIAALYHDQNLYNCLRVEPSKDEQQSSDDITNVIEATIVGLMTSPDDGNITAISLQRIKTATSNASGMSEMNSLL
jgi:hypothetical protein